MAIASRTVGAFGAVVVTTIISTSLDSDVPVLIVGAIAAGIAAWLLLRRGQPLPNAFGAPPTGWFGHAPGLQGAHHARSAIWTLISISGAMLISYAIISISHGMRESRERNMEFVRQHEQQQ